MNIPIRPHSAHQGQRSSSAMRKARQKVTGDHSNDVDPDPYMMLSREDLLVTVLQLKKRLNVIETERGMLKAENRKWEIEYLKQQQRFEKILDPKFSKNSQAVLDLRREVEKSSLVRQLKQQINDLRDQVVHKDNEYEELRNSIKASYLAELVAEKEEYYAEVQRLRQLLKEKFAAITVSKGGPSHPSSGHHSNHRGHSRESSSPQRTGHKSAGNLGRASSPYVSHHLHGPREEDSGPAVPGPFRRERPSSAKSVGASSSGSNSRRGASSGRPSRPHSAGSMGRSSKPPMTDIVADIANTNFDRQYRGPPNSRNMQLSGSKAVAPAEIQQHAHSHENELGLPSDNGVISSEFDRDADPYRENYDHPAVQEQPPEQSVLPPQQDTAVSNRNLHKTDSSIPDEDDDDDMDFLDNLAGGKAVILPKGQQEGQKPPNTFDSESPLFSETKTTTVGSNGNASQKVSSAVPAFKVDQRIEGLYGGGKKWYPGVVYKLFPPSVGSSPRSVGAAEYTYGVRYDDGDEEQRVPAERIRTVDTHLSTVNSEVEDVQVAGVASSLKESRTPQKSQETPVTSDVAKQSPSAGASPAERTPVAAASPQSKSKFVDGVLTIHAIKATVTKLAEEDVPDVYVRVKLGNWSQSTPVQQDVTRYSTATFDNLNFCCPNVTAKELQFEPLVVEVWDKNIMMKDVLIGEAPVPLLMAYIHAGKSVNISAEVSDQRGRVGGNVTITVAAMEEAPSFTATAPSAPAVSHASPTRVMDPHSGGDVSSAPTPSRQAPKPAPVIDEEALSEQKKKNDIDFMNYLADLSDTCDEKEKNSVTKMKENVRARMAAQKSPRSESASPLKSPTTLGDYDDDFDA